MRVIQVLAGAVNGGAETAFEDICLALSQSGIQQKIIVRNNNKDRIRKFRDAGIEVETLPFGGIFDFYTRWKMKKIITQYHPQIVQTWMSRATQKTPSSTGPDKTYLKVARLGGYYGLKYYKGTDYYVTIAPDIRDYLIRQGVPADKIAGISNFAEEETPKENLARAEINTPDDAIVVLALSRYHHVKALDVLIQSCQDIEKVHIWLAGAGPEEDNLKKLASDLGMADRVHFLGWRKDRAALMDAADICVFPSRYEPFGTVFVQAWAQKIPLICSKAQGPSQFVRHGEDALMFDVDNVSQLSEQIKTLISDKELADRLVKAGYARYQNEFTREKVVEGYTQFYQKIIADNGLSDKV